MSDTEALEDMNKEELYDKAQELDIDGRSSMDKDELVRAIAQHEAEAENRAEGDTAPEPVSNPTASDDGTDEGAGGFGPEESTEDLQAQDETTIEPDPVDTSNTKTVAEEYEEQHERRRAAEAKIEEATKPGSPY